MTSLNLRAMGFCGVDDSVAPELLVLLSNHFPWVEWGVLFRPDKEGLPRYASTAWVQKLSDVRKQQSNPDNVRLAAHLCGTRCQAILEGNASFVQELFALGFKRVQINATAANNVHVDPSNIDTIVANIRHCINSVPEIEYIIQCNDETQRIWQPLMSDPLANMSILFDPSCGLGVRIREFPVPPSTPHVIRCGYAGGIGPSNIDETLALVSQAAGDVPVWIDMESSLRMKVLIDGAKGDETTTKKSETDSTTGMNNASPSLSDDRFSIDKCFACIQIGIQKHGLSQF